MSADFLDMLEVASLEPNLMTTFWLDGKGLLLESVFPRSTPDTFPPTDFTLARIESMLDLDQQQTSADLSSRSGCGSQPIPATSRRCSKPLR